MLTSQFVVAISWKSNQMNLDRRPLLHDEWNWLNSFEMSSHVFLLLKPEVESRNGFVIH